MNFQAMPELNSPLGYPIALGVMATVAVGMLLFFRRKGWLGSGRNRK
jgi:magnesium transporter